MKTNFFLLICSSWKKLKDTSNWLILETEICVKQSFDFAFYFLDKVINCKKKTFKYYISTLKLKTKKYKLWYLILVIKRFKLTNSIINYINLGFM